MSVGATPGRVAVVPDLRSVPARVRAALAGGLLTTGLVALVSSNGGYFPVSWGWSSLVAFWVTALALLLGADVRPSSRELALVAALAALLGWTVLSTRWSAGSTQPALEAQRTLVYVGGVAAAILVWRRLSSTLLVAAVLAAIALACAYALATRLFPDRVGFYDPVAGYRLSAPVGYWNGLGVLATIGLLLALRFATSAGDGRLRAAAGAVLPPLALVVYFTFSRGALAALAIGLAVALAVAPHRLELAAKLAILAPAPTLAVHLAYGAGPLTRPHADLAGAVRDGHRLTVWVLLLGAVSATVAAVLPQLGSRVRVSERTRRSVGWAAVGCVVCAVAVVVAREGGLRPVRSAYRSFTAPPPHVHGNLNNRLFSLSNNGRLALWRTAWRDYRAHPLLGSGAGSFEREWLARRATPMKVRDAHSLYLETLAELGPPGLVLLCAALLVPLTAAGRVRRRPGAPLAVGAYVAFLAHAGVDWDWELPGVTLSALLVGVALLVESRPDRAPAPLRASYRATGAALAGALSAVALVSFLGASALRASDDAAAAGRWSTAARQARAASRWEPWSAHPWQRLGEAQLASGDAAAARRSFRRALRAAPSDWSVWFDLALASKGSAQRRAARRALQLDPLSPEIASSRKALPAL